MSVSLELLDCGSLTAPTAMFEMGGSDAPAMLPVPSWLIRHPDGEVVVDCGMHAEMTRPGSMLDAASLFFDIDIAPDRLVGNQLRSRQVDPEAVEIVVLSHLHFDHAGGLSQLPNARVIVQATEWAAGFDDDLAAANTFNRADFDLGHDIVPVDGEHDIFGDGLVTCLPTPGHTPGHQSVRVRTDGGDVVLCCDCAYFQRTLDGGALPGLGHDLEQQAASIELLRGLGAEGARLIPGHDAAVLAALPPKLA